MFDFQVFVRDDLPDTVFFCLYFFGQCSCFDTGGEDDKVKVEFAAVFKGDVTLSDLRDKGVGVNMHSQCAQSLFCFLYQPGIHSGQDGRCGIDE